MSRPDPVSLLPVLDASHPGLSLAARSLASPEPPMLALKHSKMGPSLTLRSCGRPGSALLFAGTARPDVAPLAVGDMQTGLPASSRSPARSGPSAPTLQFNHFDPLLAPQGASCPGTLAPVSGISRPGPCFSPSALDVAHSDASLLPRTSWRLGPRAFASDIANCASPMLVRAALRTGLAAPVCGLACPEATLPVEDCCQVDSPLPTQSPTCLGLVLPASNFGRFGSLPPSHSPSRSDLSMPVPGAARSGFVFLPPVAAMAELESFTFLKSHARPASATFVCFTGSLGLPMLLQSFARLGLVAPVLGMCRPELFSSVMGMAAPGALLLLRSLSFLGLSLFAPGIAHPGLPSPSQQAACMGLAASVVGLAWPGSHLPALGVEGLGLPALPRSLSQIESLSLASTAIQLGVAASLKSFAKPGSPATVPSHARLESLLFLRASARPGLSASAAGISCAESVFSMPVADVSTPGFPPPLRSLAQAGSSTLASGFASLGASLLLQRLAQASSPSPTVGLSRLDSSPPATSIGHPGLLLSVQSLAQLSMAASTPGASTLGPALSARSSSRFGSSSFPYAVCYAGCTGQLSVIGECLIASSLPARSAARLGTTLLVSAASKTGLALLLRSLLHAGSGLLAFGNACVGSSMPIPEEAYLDSAVLTRSFS